MNIDHCLLPFHNKTGGFSKHFKFHWCICNSKIIETLLHCGVQAKVSTSQKYACYTAFHEEV